MSAYKSKFISISSFSNISNECGTNNHGHLSNLCRSWVPCFASGRTYLDFEGHRNHSSEEIKRSLETTGFIPGKVLTLRRPPRGEGGTNSSFTAD